MRADIIAILVQRLWQATSGLVTILLIAHFLTPIQQGWYYSFLSLAALYTLFDLGLSIALVQFSAHFFIGMKWLGKGNVEGEKRDQFLGLLRQSSWIYLILALAFSALMIPAGIFFFGAKGTTSIAIGNWILPWICLVVATAANILPLPFLAFVEGSGRVGETYRIRLVQGVLGSIACWFFLVAGGGLWAASMIPIVGFLVAFVWLIVCRPVMVYNVWRRHDSGSIHWAQEVWPLQWRIGLGWFCGYLLTQIYTPVLFHYQGPVVAGQMGISLSIANMLGLLAQSWIARRVPIMAQAAGQRDWGLLDRVFAQDLVVSVLAFISGALVLCGLHHYLAQTIYGGRILPFWPFAGLLGVAFLSHVNGALAAQLRSFRREPLVWVSLGGAIFTVPAALWAASKYSAEGVVTAMLCIQLFFIFPISLGLWRKYNRKWRDPV